MVAALGNGRALARFGGVAALPVAVAVVLGALYPLTAGISPMLLPAALAAVALAAVSLTRPEIGIAAALLLLPLGRLGLTGNPPWLLPAVWSAWLLALALRPSVAQERAEKARLPRGGLAVLVYLAIGFVAFGVATDARPAFPILRTDVTGMMLFFAIARLVRTRAHVMWTLAGGVASAVIIAGAALFNLYTGRTGAVGFLTSTGDLVSRLTVGTFTQPNSLGGFLVLLAPFALGAALAARRGRFLALGSLAIICLGVYETFSRGALLGLAAVPFVFLRGRRLLVVVPFACVALLVVTPGLVGERFATANQSGGDLATRQDFWHAGLSIWQAHPVTGVGLGGFPQAYAQARLPGKQFLPDSVFQPPPHAHNLLIQTLAEEGVLGVLALLVVIGVAVRMALALRGSDARWIRVVASAMLAALVAFLIHNVFDVTLIQETGIDFWAMLGLLSALTAIATTHRTDERAG